MTEGIVKSIVLKRWRPVESKLLNLSLADGTIEVKAVAVFLHVPEPHPTLTSLKMQSIISSQVRINDQLGTHTYFSIFSSIVNLNFLPPRLESMGDQESIDSLRNLVLLISSLTQCGYNELRPNSAVYEAPFQLPGFTLPQPSGNGEFTSHSEPWWLPAKFWWPPARFWLSLTARCCCSFGFCHQPELEATSHFLSRECLKTLFMQILYSGHTYDPLDCQNVLLDPIIVLKDRSNPSRVFLTFQLNVLPFHKTVYEHALDHLSDQWRESLLFWTANLSPVRYG